MNQEPQVIEREPGTIRDRFEETRSAMTHKAETLKREVQDTVNYVSNAVAESYEGARDSARTSIRAVSATVHNTIESVKNTFDLKRQVRRRPWAMLGGSVVVGYVLGSLVARYRRRV